jgi:hypothetical protein
LRLSAPDCGLLRATWSDQASLLPATDLDQLAIGNAQPSHGLGVDPENVLWHLLMKQRVVYGMALSVNWATVERDTKASLRGSWRGFIGHERRNALPFQPAGDDFNLSRRGLESKLGWLAVEGFVGELNEPFR